MSAIKNRYHDEIAAGSEPRPTLCSECDFIHPQSRSGPSYYALCSKHPRLPGFTGFISGELWEKDPPFLYCRQVNGGCCPLFKPKRTSQIELGVDK